MTADLARLGAWDGLSMVVHAEYNFGTSANGRGGVMIPVNTALYTPGMDGGDAFDISSFYFIQAFGNGASVAFGKINMIDMVAGKPFMGGAGIDSFWNHTFTATPTGTVPPYLLGVLASVPTDAATYRLWVYDLHSYTNRSVFDDPFAGGVSIRGQVDFNVTIGGRRGHQGFSAFYSSQGGTDLETLGDTIIPSPTPGTPGIKESRYYVAYSFDQYLREVRRQSRGGIRRCSGRSPSRMAIRTACTGRCSSAWAGQGCFPGAARTAGASATTTTASASPSRIRSPTSRPSGTRRGSRSSTTSS